MNRRMFFKGCVMLTLSPLCLVPELPTAGEALQFTAIHESELLLANGIKIVLKPGEKLWMARGVPYRTTIALWSDVNKAYAKT